MLNRVKIIEILRKPVDSRFGSQKNYREFLVCQWQLRLSSRVGLYFGFVGAYWISRVFLPEIVLIKNEENDKKYKCLFP
jgi:hypothetical protein